MVRENDNMEASPARAESGLGAYLRARRAQITPERAGLQPTSGSRRAPGLRREEVAALAGISIDCYVRLERGREAHPSQSVLDSLARALLLDDREHRHLCELAALAHTRTTRFEPCPADAVRPGVLVMIQQLRPNPVFVLSRTLDVLAATPSALRLFAGLDAQPPARRNLVRYVFLHPLARRVLADWDEQARSCVARLRKLDGMDPGAPDLAELIGELLPKNPEFAELWDRFDIKPHIQGLRTFHHPEVGDVRLGWESMPLTDSPAQTLVVFYADPHDGPDHDRMVLLDVGHGQSGANDGGSTGRARRTA
ncbi:helix-turn-helix transcriptional regulator [Streptomyces phaeochromogenes]|uniref:Helix-turn-helix transcriptional regulator n=1 Tax=Streptomyces phaeochromogenes TaxID=1923 RepID=A0ABZ1H9W4_STRPH|nr:helix-turn-helix transcriptional regulator [Streptomyces phaeochromogenes]WSD14373.1 helix-turn-helix transcriptional regulator [Streptomyces phaeochromogenes]